MQDISKIDFMQRPMATSNAAYVNCRFSESKDEKPSLLGLS